MVKGTISEVEIDMVSWPHDFLEKEWQRAWGEKIKERPKSLDSWYPIENHIVAVLEEGEDKGKPVAYMGYTNKGDYALYGNAITYPKYEHKKIYSDLVKYRDSLVSPPKFAGFRPTRQDLESYIAWQESKGWIENPSDEEIAEHFGQLPEKMVNKFRSFYENDPKASWGIKKHMNAFAKAWLFILKDFEPAGE
jgi:hypothetical protein